MPVTSRFNEEINVIETVYSGNTTLTEIQEALKEILELSHKHQVTRFLADCTHLENGTSILDSYEFAKVVEKIPNIHLLKEAFILPLVKETIEGIKFFETTARNRGINILVFSHREDAIKWLME
ncbi:MAG: hypothetical protein HGB19_00905 [Chlorobiales bacterium]|nr:hypothetical protein [Chlorobiales bacterium]